MLPTLQSERITILKCVVHISLTDTTLTHSNLSTVLNHVVDMGDLIDCLDIPPSVQWKIREHNKDEEQQRHEFIHYYLKTSPFALWGWGHLGGELHRWGKEDALIVAKAYIQRVPGTICMHVGVVCVCIISHGANFRIIFRMLHPLYENKN